MHSLFDDYILKWGDFIANKDDYLEGKQEVDLVEFTELVKETYYKMQPIHDKLSNNDFAEMNSEDLSEYIYLVSVISKYSASMKFDVFNSSYDIDVFNATRLVAYCLAEYGSNYSMLAPGFTQPNNGILYCFSATVTLDLIKKYLGHQIDESDHKIYTYDVNEGDISSFQDAANDELEYLINFG